MNSQHWRALLQQHRAIAVIRAPQIEQGWQMAQAVAAGGMRLIEVTWNSDRPAELVKTLSLLPNCVIGAGTLLTESAVEEAIAAGATFLFTPHTNPTLIQIAVEAGIPMIAGALSPTEIVTAWQAGAACVKVFPVQAMGGAAYLQSLRSPLAGIPLIPTGGVTIENARSFLEAGAIGVGLSNELFPRTAIADGDWSAITQQAQTLLANLSRQSSPQPTVG
ncbi:MAG: bifunctional 4-hydroxy-2-oxoglutarate aldolase/2-dehydro-3-deoxy-phosphogluconate aldolase [Leptolyngbyaceae cyanobacterium SL_7_1]|nr:bifunctional 4-hydroxy-2-oxoglutarate aldolase/2-dehydro-3-deoxy-phosphogluconate aldolase [Leptolyngbyaceae cyanobacterium SL_7_1]